MSMPVLKCGECGRFASELFPVWGPIQSSGVDHEACNDCILARMWDDGDIP